MYNRISIIGGSGCGKSTLAAILSKKLKLPAVHLDGLNYEAGWVAVDKGKRDTLISEKVTEDKWIIDGNYNKTMQERFEKADLIIWLDYSTFAQLKGVIKRYLHTHNKERPEIPGCKERLNFKFLKYVISFNQKKRPFILDKLKKVPAEKVLSFKSQRDLNKWLKKFTHDENVLNDVR